MKKKLIKNSIVIILLVILVLLIAFFVSLNTIKKGDTAKTRVVINNRNIILKNEAYIDGKIVYLSKQDIKNFFDKYIYEEGTKQIITTYGKKIAEINYNSNIVTINDSQKQIAAPIKKIEENTYIPISELKEVYDIEIEYNKEENIVIIDSLSKSKRIATAQKNINVKSQSKNLCRTIDKVKKGENLIYVLETKEGWSKVRTMRGIVGYVKTSELQDITYIRKDIVNEKQVEGKINMFWDYFSEKAKAPNRKEVIEGVNVVSPSFFYINNQGEFKTNVEIEGEQYIKWAHENGYKVWAMISNASAGKDITSKIMNNYNLRKQLIKSITEACIKYNLDGINIDFENMKQEDINMFSRFIIELDPRMKENGLALSVDVTAPDGSETWSMCYDRIVLGDVSDYLIFMAYDQHGMGSKKSGTVAGYNWIETNIKKFINTYEVKSEKLILGIPFYTRIWTEDMNGNLQNSAVVNMKDIDSNIPNGVEKKWDDVLKQNYVEYTLGSKIKKMWIEDLDSINAKLSLVKTYQLGGVSTLEKDREDKKVWSLISTELKNFEKENNVEK